MTKHGDFKRGVRDAARARGIRYTEALAELEQRRRGPFADTRPADPDALARRLEERYGIRVASVAPIDDPPTRPRGSWPGHYPWTFVVRREDGPEWVARVFTSCADRVDRVAGDAEILRFLAAQGYPAERLADQEPVSETGDGAVIVTEFLGGGRPTDADGRVTSVAVFEELGSLLGRLHALPPGPGAVARDGGSEEHDGGFHAGRPREDLAAAMGFLVDVEDQVPDAGRGAFEALRDLIEDCDDAEGLPEALTHGNYHAWAAVGVPGELSIVGWAGSGRGPRLPSLAWLLTTASEGAPEFVEAAARGYVAQIALTRDELERLPGVMRRRPLWLASLDYREAVRSGSAPSLEEGWAPPWGLGDPAHAEGIADRARRVLAP